jgi:hypothetical protein
VGEIDPQEALTYGLFTRRQARAAGLTPKEIARRLRLGRWRRLEIGLYEDVGRPEQTGDRVLKAVLRAGPQAVASHLTAAQALGWGLLKTSVPLQVTVPRTNGEARSKGVALFRRKLTKAEIAAVGVLPVTSPVRTAIDLAADADVMEAVVAVDSALRLKQVTLAQLRDAAQQRRSMPQSRQVQRVLTLVDPLSGSVPESVARVLFRGSGLPLPETQYEVRSDVGAFIGRVDFAWPDVRLVVEIDGFAWHSSEEAFKSDRDRQNELELAGWMVLRFTAKDVLNQPLKVSATVRAALAQRGQ